jgi:hypothetical protein
MRNLHRRSVPALVLGFLLCLLYSVIAAGQVLGALGLYNVISAVPLALIILGICWHFYFSSLSATREDGATFTRLDLFFSICAVVLIGVVIATPLAMWPTSPAGKSLTWDAGLYHFPKAIELFRSGSTWDANVCYAEYPPGYESLLSFSMLLGGSAASFGLVHFVLALFLIAALWLLAQRASRLPAGLLLLGVVLVLLSGFLNDDANPWWVYYPLLFTVGKNDLLQGAAVLAVLALAPLRAARDETFEWSPVGFAMASMVAFSIKPNSLVILPLWLLAFYHLWKTSFSRRDFFQQAFWMCVIALPGLLWIPRNLIMLGALFTSPALKLSGWSIASNLANPNLSQHIPIYLYFFLGVAGLVLILALLRQRITFLAALMLLILLVGFAVTPASAFHGNTAGRAEIAWRFAIAFISYAMLLLLAVAAPLLRKLVDWAGRYRAVWAVVAILGLALSGFFLWRMRQLVRYVPQNEIILHDQFEQSVGTGGYYSAYDYARKSISDSTIIVDNGLPFYAYDAAFTNSTACSGHADYFIVFNTDWDKFKPGEYPEYVSTVRWGNDWDVVYEDGYSRVYKRR